ncbi:MAG TPA: holo-ACP synthase [Blastocatellia bacterium]|nr:holo-ACP synthase [Blastocatellia bacterium]
MIIAIGIDLIEILRIKSVLAKSGNRFRDRVFTRSEIEYCESQGSPFASYAARFAAKEAGMKALGKGWFDGVRWTDIEVTRADSGRPTIKLDGAALDEFNRLGGERIHLSLSHSRELAIAQVVIDRD